VCLNLAGAILAHISIGVARWLSPAEKRRGCREGAGGAGGAGGYGGAARAAEAASRKVSNGKGVVEEVDLNVYDTKSYLMFSVLHHALDANGPVYYQIRISGSGFNARYSIDSLLAGNVCFYRILI
jgi:hypothetical protein